MDVAPTSHSEEAYDFYKMELTFQQAIDSDYLRNNKTNGSKNLRCFPSCSFPMHCERGFCGQPLFAELYIWCVGSEEICDFDKILSKLLIVGEFQPCNNEFDGLKEVVDVDYLLENIMPPSPLFYVAQRNINFVGDESFPVAEDAFDFDNSSSLFPGPAALVHTKKYVLNLKFESKSWQYSWKSTRCTKDTQHAFIVSVLSPVSELSSSTSSPSLSQLLSCESSDYSSIGADRPHAPQHLRRLLQRASQSFTVSCVRRSDKAKQIKKQEKTSVKSMLLLQSILDQTSAQKFTPCILPGHLPLPHLSRDEDDEEHSMSMSIALPSQQNYSHHNHHLHHCHAHLSKRSLSSSSSATEETESIGEVGYKRGSDYLYYGEDDRRPPDAHNNINTLKTTKTNELANFSPALEAAYRSVFGYSA